MYDGRGQPLGWPILVYGVRITMQVMSTPELFTQTKEIKPGDHLVVLYSDESEIVDYVSAYIQSALAQKARCIYITGDLPTTEVLNQLEAVTKGLAKNEDLVIVDRCEIYSENGVFSPDKLVKNIKTLVQAALRDGYDSLAITGELSWLVDYADAEELIMEYEWKLNEYVFDKYPISALCRYNINKFSDQMIRNVIQTHPIILWKNKIHENPYYIPPQGFKADSAAKHQVKTWLENIDRFTDKQSRFENIFAKKQEEIRLLHAEMTNGIIAGFLKLLEMHDPYTKDHCTNVASLTVRLAEKLQMSEDFKTKIYYAALIHDIGKTIIPKEILNKPGRLTAEEYQQIQMHPIYGAQALAQVKPLEEITLAVRHHHERYDGGGYPSGLAGERIPLMARIITICDSYDAMTNDRPYRKACTHEEALKEITFGAGGQFDPNLIEPFKALFVQEKGA